MEIWKDIRDYEGLYQVSNLGRIKSLDRIIVDKNKTLPFKGRILKPYNGNDYLYVTLYKNGKIKKPRVHRLVAGAFIDNPKQYPIINHKNGTKDDNSVDNLEWCDQLYNMRHASKIGLFKNKKGKHVKPKTNKGKSKTVYQYDLNKNYIQKFSSTTEVERQLNVCRSNVSKCCREEVATVGGYIWRYEVNNYV